MNIYYSTILQINTMVAVAGILIIVAVGAVIIGGCIYGYCKLMQSRQAIKAREARWDCAQKHYDDIFIKGVN
jgi:hypothetical protein